MPLSYDKSLAQWQGDRPRDPPAGQVLLAQLSRCPRDLPRLKVFARDAALAQHCRENAWADVRTTGEGRCDYVLERRQADGRVILRTAEG